MADPSSGEGLGAEKTFWRRTPPALFPAVFGLLGLGMAWRSAALAFPSFFSASIGEWMLLIVGVFYVFCLSSYISKLSHRPAVLFEDVLSPPGRAGASTMTLCLFLVSAALAPYASITAGVILFIGLIAHTAMAAAAILVMSQQDKGMKVTPAWHLIFVGFNLAPLAALPLGFVWLSVLIFALTFLAAAVIYAVSYLQMQQGEMPAAARPLLFIHLAPVSLFATVSALLGWVLLSFAFVVLAVGVGAVLASRYPAIAEAGFSPLWGAFTFPVAALATAIFMVSFNAPALAWLGLIPLILVSVATPVIAVRIMLLWLNGQLAQQTGAAVA